MQGTDDLSSLMRRANRGDAGAYRQLLSLLSSRLRMIARSGLARAGRGPEDAEDIVQETLLAVHLKRHTWNELEKIEPWVRAIAHHKLIDGLRQRGFREHIPIEDCDELLVLAVEPNAIQSLECTELLGRLSQRQRAIVEGMTVEGRSAREMGDRLGIAEGTVRVTLHRALKSLTASTQLDEA